MTLISVVIPTVAGREDHYARCRDALLECSAIEVEIITEFGRPSCGMGWQAGAVRATGDYIALLCDDLEPLDGWDVAAVEAVGQGCIPAPKVTDGRNGALQSRPYWGMEFTDGTDCGISIVPFMSRAQWEVIQPLFTAHYYTDDFVSERARRAGWPPLMCNRYAFRHHWAQPGRGAGMTENERMAHDQIRYSQALAMVGAGQWNAPWPPEGR